MEDIQIKEFQKKAYGELYIIENILRLSIHSYYIEKYGNDYFNDKLIPSYIDGKSIVDTVFERIEEAKINNEIAKKDNGYFWFLDLRVLIEIVNHNWDKGVKDIFNNKAPKDHIVQLLNGIKNTRNAIAHNRSIKKERYFELVTVKEKLFELLRNKYMKNIELLLEEDKNVIFEKINQIVSNFLGSINQLRPIMKNDINELYVCSIHLPENNYEPLIKELNEYNAIPKHKDNGKLADIFISEKGLRKKLKNILVGI